MKFATLWLRNTLTERDNSILLNKFSINFRTLMLAFCVWPFDCLSLIISSLTFQPNSNSKLHAFGLESKTSVSENNIWTESKVHFNNLSNKLLNDGVFVINCEIVT